MPSPDLFPRRRSCRCSDGCARISCLERTAHKGPQTHNIGVTAFVDYIRMAFPSPYAKSAHLNISHLKETMKVRAVLGPKPPSRETPCATSNSPPRRIALGSKSGSSREDRPRTTPGLVCGRAQPDPPTSQYWLLAMCVCIGSLCHSKVGWRLRMRDGAW